MMLVEPVFLPGEADMKKRFKEVHIIGFLNEVDAGNAGQGVTDATVRRLNARRLGIRGKLGPADPEDGAKQPR